MLGFTHPQEVQGLLGRDVWPDGNCWPGVRGSSNDCDVPCESTLRSFLGPSGSSPLFADSSPQPDSSSDESENPLRCSGETDADREALVSDDDSKMLTGLSRSTPSELMKSISLSSSVCDIARESPNKCSSVESV